MPIRVVDPAALAHPTSHRSATGEPLSDVAHLSDLLGLSALRIGHEVLPPGRRAAPSHRHTHRDEVVIVVQGTPTAVLGTERRQLGPGEIVAFPAGSPDPHELVNESTGDVVIWSVSATLGPDTVLIAG